LRSSAPRHADVERDLIRTRTAEGSRAKAQGQPMADPRIHAGAAERGHPTPRRRRYTQRTRPQLRRRHIHHSPSYTHRMSSAKHRSVLQRERHSAVSPAATISVRRRFPA
jgi:hypothetical protein